MKNRDALEYAIMRHLPLHLRGTHAHDILGAILEALAAQIGENGRVTIRGFGQFKRRPDGGITFIPSAQLKEICEKKRKK